MDSATARRPLVLVFLLVALLGGPTGLLGLTHADRHGDSAEDRAGHATCMQCAWSNHSAVESDLPAPAVAGPDEAPAPDATAAPRPVSRAPRHSRFLRGPPTPS